MCLRSGGCIEGGVAAVAILVRQLNFCHHSLAQGRQYFHSYLAEPKQFKVQFKRLGIDVRFVGDRPAEFEAIDENAALFT